LEKLTSDTKITVLGIVGSPRHGGNTEILVDTVLKGAKEAGALTKIINLNEMKLTPCQSCNACRKTRICIQDDDMSTLLELMQKSQVWVLGTPIYWWGPTAQFKAFIDRWYSVRSSDFNGRKIILAISMGGGSTHYARHTVGMLTDICQYLDMDLVATILAPGASGLGDVRSHETVITTALKTGRDVVQDFYSS
jgi:multimeric flavodoxin WrbA